jgi:hypothetical protein
MTSPPKTGPVAMLETVIKGVIPEEQILKTHLMNEKHHEEVK